MKKQPIYIQILIRLAFLIVPIVALYFLLVFNYNPHENDFAGEHNHSMGPWLGFFFLSVFIAGIWLIAIIAELIWRRFKTDKKVAYWLIFLLIFASLMAMYFF